ncbi:unnamed protein product [Kuraishia capsulata CBS 1993]|uniref:Uncharacterized protein n=1 Tax=Kuraishia capsulata CBS 1993 TaxID=1382522 RepID=W6MLM8_9ASCO|nr:uncharacterized protein KUCA_T00001727001 [Kuraishia capsulata CBS 1993]CDK25757.1 unnamed protein product [Kuraishia capsulata CBS 1993]
MARQNFVGYVISQGKMDKTIKVRVLQKYYDAKVHKDLFKRKDFLVHDEGNICKEGDLVRIEATRPLSSRKFFAVAEIKRNIGQQFAKYAEEAKQRVSEEEQLKTREFLERTQLKDNDQQLVFLGDLRTVASLKGKELTPEEQETVSNLKKKYMIQTWDDQQLFQMEFERLEEKVQDLLQDYKLTQTLQSIIASPDKSAEVLQRTGLSGEEIEKMRRNVRKNIIRKFLKKADDATLLQLGIQL